MASIKGKLPIAGASNASEGIAMSAPNKPSKEDMERQRRYRAEDAMRDLERAEGHKKDKALMRDVKTMAKEKMNNLKKIC
jgi:hypothetical protein